MPSGVRVTTDQMRAVAESVGRLAKTELLVGIPADKAARQEGDAHGASRDINNAELGYIHEFGAPEANIPPRPFLVPGVDANKDRIVERMERAGRAALEGLDATVQAQMQAAGIETVRKITARIQAGLQPPLSPNTMRERDPKSIADLRKQGNNEHSVANYLASRKPLVDTGALLASISYVVRRAGKDDVEGQTGTVTADGAKDAKTSAPKHSLGQRAETAVKEVAEGVGEAGEALL